jgi:adenosine deaminase
VRRGPGGRRRRLRRIALRARTAPGSRAEPGRGRGGRGRRLPRGGAPRGRGRTPDPGGHAAHRDAARRALVGDIAGAEAGYPPTRHLDAFEYLRRENFHFTIHAGEAFGLPSIWEALQWCGADRLGHGNAIMDDILVSAEGEATLGRLAAYVRDKRIPLEMCPTSNLQTGAARSYESHPIGLLRRLHFRVTVNTDNRLMSSTSMTREFSELHKAFGYGLEDMQWFTINALKSAFLPFDQRLELINGYVKPAYEQLRDQESSHSV